MTRKKTIKKRGTSNQKKGKERLWLLLVVLVTFVVFSPSLKNGFTNWDDDLYITKNTAITSISWENLDKFSDNYVGNFHPLTMFSLALDYHFWGLNPFYFHLKNILFHLLNTLLAFFLIKKITRGNLFISLGTALLFGIHPMHVESVTWVAERKDVLYSFYFLTGLLLYFEYISTKKWFYLFATAAAFVFSALAKSAAVIFPVVLFLIDYFENRKFSLKSILEKIPLLAFSVYIGMVALKTQSQSNALGDFEFYTFFERVRFASFGFINYLVKFIFPHHLSSFHPYPGKANIPQLYNLSLVAALALVAALLIWGRKKRWLVFGFGFYLITVALVLQFVTVGNAIIAERYTYLPYIGVGFIYLTFLNSVFTENRFIKMRDFAGLVLAAQIIYFLTATFNQTKVWKNSDTLWTNVIEKYPNESGAYSNRGHYFRTQNNYEKALKDYNTAIKIDNKNHRAFSNRGKVWFDTGQIDKAIADYNRSIEINDKNAETYSNRGAAFGMKKQWDLALKDLSKAVDMDQKNTNALSNRGYVYFHLKEYEKNIADYRKYLQLKPNDADIINTIGLCYFYLNDFDSAIKEYNQSIKIDPTKGAYFMNRSLTFSSKGDKTNALNDALKAKQLGHEVNPNYLQFLKTK